MASIPSLLTLEVATPTGWALEPTQVSSVQAPSVFGEFGVLPGHLPLLVALKAGPLHYVVDGTTKHAAIGGTGYAQVDTQQDGSGKLRVLADSTWSQMISTWKKPKRTWRQPSCAARKAVRHQTLRPLLGTKRGPELDLRSVLSAILNTAFIANTNE